MIPKVKASKKGRHPRTTDIGDAEETQRRRRGDAEETQRRRREDMTAEGETRSAEDTKENG